MEGKRGGKRTANLISGVGKGIDFQVSSLAIFLGMRLVVASLEGSRINASITALRLFAFG